MEVGQHHVDRAKAVAGGDEQRGLAGKRRKRTVFARRAFQQTQRGRADGDNAAAGAARCVQGRCGGRGHAAPFGVHFVAGRVVCLDRQKCAGADMQRHALQIDADIP